MERRLVNNTSSFFLIRYFSSIFFCFLTLFITGRIGDIDFLLGYIDYAAGGTTSTVARSIFSRLGGIGNRYIIISLIAAICSILLFILIKSFIDKKNINIWKLTLIAPGLLIYTNSVTKETLFIYPAIAFIVLESLYLTGKNTNNFYYFSNLTLRICLLLLMISIRGDLTAPYIILFFLSIVFKNLYFGNIFKNLEFKSLILISFIASLIVTFLIIFFQEDYFSRTIGYLEASFRYKNNFRPNIDLAFIKDPLNYLYIQYLSLFTTPLELIEKPYKIFIILDSFLLIYSFTNAWKSLFKQVNSHRVTRQIIAFMFTFIAIVYFSLFGILGSFNLGSSQRLRTNYVPIGIIFPLVLEKVIRDKKLHSKSHS